MNNSFTNASNYLSQVLPSRRSMNVTRNVAETGRGGRGFGGRGRGRGGRGFGRGGRGFGRGFGGRSGRGRGNNNFRSGRGGRGTYSTSTGNMNDNDWIPYREWMSMSYDERQRVLSNRRNQDISGNQQIGGHYESNRNINQSERAMQMLSTVVEDIIEGRSNASRSQNNITNSDHNDEPNRTQSTATSRNPARDVFIPRQNTSGQISAISGVSSLFSSRSRRT